MRVSTLLAALAAAVAVRADKASFDCAMRGLAVEFAASANPGLSAEALAGIAAALDGAPEKPAGCNVTVPTALAAARELPALAGPPLRSVAGATVYVDYAAGSDSAAGTQAAPFKTVARGLAATRAAGAGSAIILRAGTHFLAAPLVLDARDTGLTVQSFPGEAAWLSRGTPLAGITWTPYNQTGGSGTWDTFPGQNAVYGAVEGPTFHYFGNTDDAPTCQAACAADYARSGRCTIYTWHDKNQGSYALNCWFRYDGNLQLDAESGHLSGFLDAPQNVWVADLSALSLAAVVGLRDAAGKRLVRARYPNADPELGFGSSLSATSWTRTSVPVQPGVQFRPPTPERNSSYSFIHYQGGYGGICAVPGFGFTESPGSMYWCGNQTEGGGAFTWRTPVGMSVSASTLPHLPYANAAGAVVQAWHPERWASRMYLLDGSSITWDAATKTADIAFVAGGFQDARGSDDAGNFYIENVFEELDAPSEWFYNETTHQLFLYYNATAGTPPPGDGSLVAVAGGASALITVAATQAAPLRGLALRGLGFRDTAYVYFEPHSIPSGGDWALSRTAAVLLEGTEGTAVAGCRFERLDGTALMLSGYNRGAEVVDNDFVWIGGSAMVSWGRTAGDPTGTDGPDGTNGDQPRYSHFARNVGHELGIWEKQSSLLMQAKTSDSLVEANVGFNGPRAGINQNDGFGGNNSFVKNLVFNMCRESGDRESLPLPSTHTPSSPIAHAPLPLHLADGPFNSWDRQVFETYKGAGSTGFGADWNFLTSNFLLSNYESQEGIDNDDGSAYYNSSRNFLVYSGNGMKSDFGGHDNVHHHNVYAYVGAGFSICNQLKGHPDQFYANHLVQDRDGDYGGGQACKTTADEDATVVHDNVVYTPTGTVTECGMTLAQWQAAGNDPGTTAAVTPADTDLLAFARAALGM
jgi:hypothetical protein